MAPWIYLHIMPNGGVLPCCTATTIFGDYFGNADKEDLKVIWNNERYKKLRLNMLSGKKSSTCQKCYDLENSNLKSMRNSINGKFSDDFSLVKRTHENGSLNEVNIKYFDVRFSNFCNFKCRGCSPHLSSAWYEDQKKMCSRTMSKLAAAGFKNKIVNVTAKGQGRLWRRLEALIPNIKIASFTGGEPLIIDEHYMTLKTLLKHHRNDVILQYNTNLSVLSYKKYNLIEFWKQFPNIHVAVSMDDINDRAEYFRKGLNWNKFIDNLITLKEQVPHVNFNITPTVNITNIYYIPELYHFFLKEGFIKPYGMIFSILFKPYEYSVQVLPINLKKEVTKKLKNSVLELKKQNPDMTFDDYQDQINGIINYMNEIDMSILLSAFAHRTIRLDSIRNESFVKVFPKLRCLLVYGQAIASDYNTIIESLSRIEGSSTLQGSTQTNIKKYLGSLRKGIH